MNREQNHKLTLLLILSACNSLIHTPLWVSWTLKSLLSLTGQLQCSHVCQYPSQAQQVSSQQVCPTLTRNVTFLAFWWISSSRNIIVQTRMCEVLRSIGFLLGVNTMVVLMGTWNKELNIMQELVFIRPKSFLYLDNLVTSLSQLQYWHGCTVSHIPFANNIKIKRKKQTH